VATEEPCLIVTTRGTNFAESRRVFRSSVKTAWHVPSIRQPPQKFHALLIAYLHVLISPTSAIKSSFTLTDSRPERGWSSTEVRLFLNFLNQSNVRVRLKRSLPKAVFNISKVFASFFPSLRQNMIHTRCSFPSDILKGT